MLTKTGGIISLALGAQGRIAADFVPEFRKVCEEGFRSRTFAKLWGIGYLARKMGPIYIAEHMEAALKKAFFNEGSSSSCVFGMQNYCRTAITTTIGKLSLIHI